MIGVYAGSFDPFTNGHLEIVQQAAKIFDHVVVLVATNPGKQHWLSQAERQKVIRATLGDMAEVAALEGNDTSAEYAFKRGACLIRGLGDFTDYSAEKTLAGINSRFQPDVETVFFMTRGQENQMRSSSVREASKYRFGWRSIRDTVPQATFNAVVLKLLAAREPVLGNILDKADLSRYSKRPYHNFEHLVYMMEMADMWGSGMPAEAKPNLWAAIVYHDIFVDSDLDVADGEDVARSVEWLREVELPGCDRERVAELVAATDHRLFTFSPDRVLMTAEQALMCRLDMAVLGESLYEYARYAKAVREEYAAKYGYLSEAFRSGRLAFLKTMQGLLAAGDLINPAYDVQMALNLEWELQELNSGR